MSEESLMEMTAVELYEALLDQELGFSPAAAAALTASYGAALLARAAGKSLREDKEDIAGKASVLCTEISHLVQRLDMADELVRSSKDETLREGLSAAVDASISLLEATYFGQSMARKAAESTGSEGALDLGTASMMMDAGAGAAILAIKSYLEKAKDKALDKKAEEMVWAITHDRVGLKRQILELVDKHIREEADK